MTEALPAFPYHPDPVATGSVVRSDFPCACCGRARGYVYPGPVYVRKEEAAIGALCPWCIADGSAAARFGAEFTGDSDVPDGAWEAIATRTPGYSARHRGYWLAHCGDGAAFMGAVGTEELAPYPDAVETLRQEAGGWGWSPVDVEHYLNVLHKDRQPTAYLFRCRVCGTHLAYTEYA
ncbi:CbrC family protein [Streptomyces sp. NPDC007100]|uniref:CbrC family protein n=1 Tax=Streptomyces sp. NPDC007100 TaxID=3155602 RepID=UPI0034039E02